MRAKALSSKQVTRFVGSIFEEDLHAKRVASVASATLGAVEAASLSIHAIGHGLAETDDLNAKHAIKQVDRLLSNTGVVVWDLFALWVPYKLGERSEVVVALDWTDFDHDNQSTIAIHMLTSHGRATPLLWKTVMKTELKDNRNLFEDQLLQRLREVTPAGVKVTVLADRGFGDHKLYEEMKLLEFDYVIRFKGNVTVASQDGERRTAAAWVPDTGRPLLLRAATVTQYDYEIPGGGVREGQSNEGTMVPRDEPQHGSGLRGGEAVRPSLHNRRELSRHQGHPLRDGAGGNQNQGPCAARSAFAHRRARDGLAHAARRRWREPGNGPHVEGQHLQEAHPFIVYPGLALLPANPKHEGAAFGAPRECLRHLGQAAAGLSASLRRDMRGWLRP
jgi:hypothetical protein